MRVGRGEHGAPPNTQNKTGRTHPSLEQLADCAAPMGLGRGAKGLGRWLPVHLDGQTDNYKSTPGCSAERGSPCGSAEQHREGLGKRPG